MLAEDNTPRPYWELPDTVVPMLNYDAVYDV